MTSDDRGPGQVEPDRAVRPASVPGPTPDDRPALCGVPAELVLPGRWAMPVPSCVLEAGHLARGYVWHEAEDGMRWRSADELGRARLFARNQAVFAHEAASPTHDGVCCARARLEGEAAADAAVGCPVDGKVDCGEADHLFAPRPEPVDVVRVEGFVSREEAARIRDRYLQEVDTARGIASELRGELAGDPPRLTAQGNLLLDADGEVVGMMESPSWARVVARYARVAAAVDPDGAAFQG